MVLRLLRIVFWEIDWENDKYESVALEKLCSIIYVVLDKLQRRFLLYTISG